MGEKAAARSICTAVAWKTGCGKTLPRLSHSVVMVGVARSLDNVVESVKSARASPQARDVERDPALRFATQIIGYLQGIRAVAAEVWDMR